MKMTQGLTVKYLGLQDYLKTWLAMRDFTQQRVKTTPDEIWILEHPPVFTQGQAGKPEHILSPGDIPIIQTDRGGQVTYHGPGQLVMYVLLDLKRLGIGIRQLVRQLEACVIQVLASYQITANTRCDAPGVYVNESKICSIGLRVKQGCCYHGIAFNVSMDTEPFLRINPCGFLNLKVTQVCDFEHSANIETIQKEIVEWFINIFGYADATFQQNLKTLVTFRSEPDSNKNFAQE